MKKIITLVYLGLIALFANAQEPVSLSISQVTPNMHDKLGDNEIVELTHQLYKAISEIEQKQDGVIEPVTKYLDKDFTAVRIITDVNGSQTRSQLNLDAYRKQLFSTAKFTGLSTSYQIDDINFVRTYETVAVINYSLTITATLDGEEVLKFRSIVTNYLRRNENKEWKVMESNGLNVFREQEVGICPVAFAKTGKDGTQYAATIVSPAGNTFNTDVVNFTFKGTEGKTLITSGQSAWLLSGKELSCLKDNGKTVNNKLGNAGTKIECVNLILSNHLYSNKCISFKTLER